MIDIPLHQAELEQLYLRTVGAGLRSIAITSPSQGAGVSTVAWALARRAAAGGRRTLLVEFNVARPALGRRTDHPAVEWSLRDRALRHAIASVDQPNLAVLPAPIRADASLASRERQVVERAFAEWTDAHDLVVADLPAVNAQHPSNLPVPTLCAACDGTLLVVLAGRDRAAETEAAVTALGTAGARLCGAVANDRFNPSLASELARETRRLDRILPPLARGLRRMIDRSSLLAARP